MTVINRNSLHQLFSNSLFVCAFVFAHFFESNAQTPDLNLIPYRKGNKWGYCTPEKKVIVAPRFDKADVFYGALTTAVEDSQYCIINRQGKTLFRSKSYCNTINDGSLFVGVKEYGHEQLFSADGKAVTKEYYHIQSFNRYGYACVTANYVKVGLIDRSFKEVVAPAYGSIEFYNARLAKVYNSELRWYGLINLPTGRLLASGYGHIYAPREGLLMVEKSGKYGFIDTNGREVIAATYGKAFPADVKPGTSYNESSYEDYNYDGFYEGVAVLTKEGKSGYINRSGKTVIPFVYEKAYGFSNGKAWVRISGKWGMINKKGATVLPAEQLTPNFLYAKELEALDGFHEGLIAVARDSLFGYCDTSGNLKIPAIYSRALPFYEGMAAVYQGDKMGFIDPTGKWVIPPIYKWVNGAGEWKSRPFENSCAVALLPEDKWVLIDKQGHRLLPHEFDLSSSIWFENDVANASVNEEVYVFTSTGTILHKFPKGHIVNSYSPELFYDYSDECFMNIAKNVKYCE